MKQTEFALLLKESLQADSKAETENRREDMALLVRREAARRHRRQRIPFRRFLSSQIRYIGWRLWTVQIVLLLLFDRMAVRLYGERFWDSPSSVTRLLFCLSTLVAMMALPLLRRSATYRMQEVESASYFSAVKLLTAKLVVIGLGDVFLLAGIFLSALAKTSMEAGNLSVCLFLPFLTVSAAYLFLMGHCSSNGFFAGSVALGIAMILLAIGLPGRWLPLLSQNRTWGAALLCLGLLAFSAEQLRYLLCCSRYTELQIT